VERDFGALKHQEELRLVGMDPLEREIERLKTGLLGKKVVKARRQ
jgi:hypothetical protein